MKHDLSKVPSPDDFLALTPEEQEAVVDLNSMKDFEKGYVLISEGQYFKASFFVVTGIVRQFKLVDGREVTSEFYTDKQSILSSNYASRNKPSNFTLICASDCRISIVSFEKERELCTRFPRFENMCRMTTEREFSEYQERFSRFISSTPEERYLTLLDERPELVDKVPQYHLSSYLGIKAESLSRIRKRLSSRGKA